MNDRERQLLIGYLLSALEDEEAEFVRRQLRQSYQWREECERIEQSLDRLSSDESEHEPPDNLAHFTCRFVACTAELPSPKSTPTAALPATSSSSSWTLSDMIVAAGVCFAMAMLLAPAVNQSRHQARIMACASNLQQVGLASLQYRQYFHGYFPYVPVRGNQAVAGVFALRLIDHGFLPNHRVFVCPGSETLDSADEPSWPTMAQLNAAIGAEVLRLHQQIGGTYAYAVGYRDADGYRAVRNGNRLNYPLVADGPSCRLTGMPSRHHRDCGQNVLFETGQVRFVCGQEILEGMHRNDRSEVAAGVHRDDAVLVAGDRPPIPLVYASSR